MPKPFPMVTTGSAEPEIKSVTARCRCATIFTASETRGYSSGRSSNDRNGLCPGWRTAPAVFLVRLAARVAGTARLHSLPWQRMVGLAAWSGSFDLEAGAALDDRPGTVRRTHKTGLDQ